jgi:hypothetical protein
VESVAVRLAHELAYMADDPLTPDQVVIRIGLRTTGIKTVRGVKVRIVGEMPSDVGLPHLDIDTEAILHVRGGTPLVGRDVDDGDELFPQLLTVRCRTGRALPDVKVNYAHSRLSETYPALPTGEWLLTLKATGTDVAPARRHFALRITDDPDRRKRAILHMEPDEDDED